MKKLIRQPHKIKTLIEQIFLKTVWRVGGIIEKLRRKNCLMTVHPNKKDIKILWVKNKETCLRVLVQFFQGMHLLPSLTLT